MNDDKELLMNRIEDLRGALYYMVDDKRLLDRILSEEGAKLTNLISAILSKCPTENLDLLDCRVNYLKDMKSGFQMLSNDIKALHEKISMQSHVICDLSSDIHEIDCSICKVGDTTADLRDAISKADAPLSYFVSCSVCGHSVSLWPARKLCT